MKKLVLLCLAAIAGMTLFPACSKGSGENIIPTPEPTPEPVQKMEIRISPSPGQTRASDQGFDNGDRIGIYVVNYDGENPGKLKDSGNHVDNMRFTYSGTWTPDTPIFWKDETTHADIYLVYPYTAISSVTQMPFSVKTDQSKAADYTASDLMIGIAANVAPTEEAVGITANHVLSHISISLQAGNGFTEESLAAAEVAVKINGLLTDATVDIASASVTPGGVAATIIPLLQNGSYRALAIPQTVADTNLITVTVDGKDYNLKKSMTFQGGKSYKFNVTLSNTSAGINVTIGAWENDGEDYGGTAE